MKINVNYDNIAFEFEAETKEDVYDAEKLIKASIFAFGTKELNKTNGMIKGEEKANSEPAISKDTLATEKQLAWLVAHHVAFKDGITKKDASALIEANGGGKTNYQQPKRRVD